MAGSAGVDAELPSSSYRLGVRAGPLHEVSRLLLRWSVPLFGGSIAWSGHATSFSTLPPKSVVGFDWKKGESDGAVRVVGAACPTLVRTHPPEVVAWLISPASIGRPCLFVLCGSAAPLARQLYPSHVSEGLREALEAFDARMPGFVCGEALLHGVETRTSSPVQVRRLLGVFVACEAGRHNTSALVFSSEGQVEDGARVGFPSTVK